MPGRHNGHVPEEVSLSIHKIRDATLRVGIALLMFNYNENEGIIRNIELLKDVVNEILIIDSSDDNNYNYLKNKYEHLDKFSIIRVFPIGYPEPFRMFAIKNIKSEFILYLDSDEEPNEKLIKFLSDFKYNGIDGYYILRYEKALKCYDYQLRLYKKDKTFYKGMIHEFPKIEGLTSKLDSEKFIIHHAEFKNYLNTRPSYLLIEAYERPFSIFYLSTQSNFVKLFKNKDKILSKSLVYLFDLLLFVKRTLDIRSLKLKTYRYGRFLLKYTIKRYKYFIKLNYKERLIKINQCIILNNGIIKYLNLDNVDYVNKLTKNFQWNKKGIEVFEELINYRYNYKKNKDEI